MKICPDPIRKFLVSEDGPTAVEYAVMLALIVVVCLTALLPCQEEPERLRALVVSTAMPWGLLNLPGSNRALGTGSPLTFRLLGQPSTEHTRSLSPR